MTYMTLSTSAFGANRKVITFPRNGTKYGLIGGWRSLSLLRIWRKDKTLVIRYVKGKDKTRNSINVSIQCRRATATAHLATFTTSMTGTIALESVAFFPELNSYLRKQVSLMSAIESPEINFFFSLIETMVYNGGGKCE
jgi:hypothetical protein